MHTGSLHGGLTGLADTYKFCINTATAFKSSVSVFEHDHGIFQQFLLYFYNKRWDLSSSKSNASEGKMSLNNKAMTGLWMLLVHFYTLEIPLYRPSFWRMEQTIFMWSHHTKWSFRFFSKIIHQKARHWGLAATLAHFSPSFQREDFFTN